MCPKAMESGFRGSLSIPLSFPPLSFPLSSSPSASVLLDLSFRAKLCNLGLARPLDKDINEARTARVVGTSGYIPPEYYRGIITTKMDAFGFGVVGNSFPDLLHSPLR